MSKEKAKEDLKKVLGEDKAFRVDRKVQNGELNSLEKRRIAQQASQEPLSEEAQQNIAEYLGVESEDQDN